MEIKTVKISELRPHPKNPRVHPDSAIEKLERSIKEYGWTNPVLVSADGYVLAGHARLKAAEKAGIEEVPVIYLPLEGEKAEAYLVADNRLQDETDWDYEKLKNLLQELDTGEIDLELTGFGMDEIEDLMTQFHVPGEIIEDDVPEPPDEPITKPGDLWILGRHRLLCGDSTDRETVEKLMNGAELEIVYTDPPYSSGGYQESGKTSGSIGARGGKKIENDNLSTRGYISLMDRVLALSRKAHTIFIFCDWKMWATNQDIAEAKGYRVRNMIVWDKCHMGMGMPFRNQHELCLFGSKLAGKIGDGKTPNVISVPRDRESKHATSKPVELIKPMLNQIEGNTVYDPFGGSGSTLIACEQLNRTCYMMELDPVYCDVIVQRYINLKGHDGDVYLERDGNKIAFSSVT